MIKWSKINQDLWTTLCQNSETKKWRFPSRPPTARCFWQRARHAKPTRQPFDETHRAKVKHHLYPVVEMDTLQWIPFKSSKYHHSTKMILLSTGHLMFNAMHLMPLWSNFKRKTWRFRPSHSGVNPTIGTTEVQPQRPGTVILPDVWGMVLTPGRYQLARYINNQESAT